MSVHDRHKRAAASTPVNATAGRVLSGGTHWDNYRKGGDTKHWTAPPSTVPLPKTSSFQNLTGITFGRFFVIGYLGKTQGGKSGRWLVKCACGDYEARSHGAITNPKNAADMCVECRHLEYIKDNDGRSSAVPKWERGQ